MLVTIQGKVIGMVLFKLKNTIDCDAMKLVRTIPALIRLFWGSSHIYFAFSQSYCVTAYFTST